MPYKDPEAQKKAQKELMRQRRAQAKLKAGENLPPAIPGQSVIPPKASLEPNTPAPASRTSIHVKPSKEYQVDWKARAKEPRPQYRQEGFISSQDIPENYWSRFPGQAGRPCFNDARYSCCYDLNFPVSWERSYCPGHPDKPCGYSRPMDLFEMAGVEK
jgi:hypothetical protein